MDKLSLEFQEVSILNGVEVVSLNEGVDTESLIDSHDFIILGSEYLFKVNMSEVDHTDSGFYQGFSHWVSYTLFAGILKLALRKSKIDLKMGLSLKNFYQNHSQFNHLIKSKVLNYYLNGKSKRKSVELLNVDIYPNIYAQSLFIEKIFGLNKFIAIHFSMDGFEGMVYDGSQNSERQKYVLGNGYSYFETNFRHDVDLAIKNGTFANEPELTFEFFLEFHLRKKINFLVSSDPSLKIFFVVDDMLDDSVIERFTSFAGKGSDYTLVEGGANVSCHGLFETYSNNFHSKLSQVTVSINEKTSTFLNAKK